MASPQDRYNQLPDETRDFLEGLREEDIDTLNESIRFMRSAKTISWFLKWALLAIIGAFLTAAAFGDAVLKVWGWVIGPFGGAK